MSYPIVSLSYARTILLISLTCLLIYGFISHPPIPALRGTRVTSLSSSRKEANLIPSIDTFVSAATNDTLRRYNSLPMEKFCNRESWNNSIAVNCDYVSGGIGNVKQEILSCVRYAMLEGKGLIIPWIELRSSEDLSELHSGYINFDYLFNRELFKSRLGSVCPHMTIYDTIEEVKKNRIEIDHYPPTLTGMLICDDPPEFAVHFGTLLNYPTNIYRLAFTALYNLNRRHLTPISLNLADSSPSKYLGIHLRTAKDAVDHGSFSSYEFQRDSYMSTAYTVNLPVVYAASGNLTSVLMFADRAKYFMPDLKVVTKEKLLFGSDRQELASLSWDQAALVDYILLERASFFAGVKESSFTWNVMLTRAAVRGGVDAVCGPKQRLGEHEVWRDPWTVIHGDFPEGVDHEDIKSWP